MLIALNARLSEVDKSGRTAIDIANSHEYQNIVDILNKQLKPDDASDNEDKSIYLNTQLRSWQDYYPGINKGEK